MDKSNINSEIGNPDIKIIFDNYKNINKKQFPLDSEICVVSDETGKWYIIAGWDNVQKLFINQYGVVHPKYKYWIPLLYKLPIGEKITSLTYKQKLQALSSKYYDGLEWQPKKGDYYTTSRNDLELYQIVDENETTFFTNYCGEKKSPEPHEWLKTEFLENFGVNRVYVPDFIFYI
jgi:hypothetical protein